MGKYYTTGYGSSSISGINRLGGENSYMAFTFTYFSFIVFAGFVITVALTGIIWTRRPSPGTTALALLMAAASIWIIGNALESSANELADRILFNKISYIGVTSSGVFWLIFTLDYTGSAWWKKPRNLFLAGIVPLLTLVMVWTNELHGLEWANVYLTEGPMGTTSIWEMGPLYLVNPITQYLLYLAGTIIIIRFGIRRKVFRRQVVLITIGIIIPLVGNVIYAARIDIAGGLDLTPLHMVAGAVIYSYAVLHFRFPDYVPVAYKAVLKKVPDGLLILDSQGFIVEANTVAEKIVGQGPLRAKILSSLWPDLDRVTGGLSDTSHAEIAVSGAGSPAYLDIGVATLFDDHHKPAGKLVLLRDVTELRTLYEKERLLRTELDAEIGRRSQYTRALVHELGTPLTSIVASVELLKALVNDPTQVKLVENVARSSSALEQRINELLELARGELGKINLETVPSDMNLLIREIVDEMRPVAAEKGIVLGAELPDGDLVAMVDKKRIRQILMNLLSNALKFSARGEISVKARRGVPGFLAVDVKDTGSGMDKDQLDNLFNPYYHQSRDGTSASGLGIGLALSKIFVTLHGGEIRVQSVPGEGTTVSFTVPSYQ